MAFRDLVAEVLPVCAVQWVTQPVHAQAIHTLLAAGRRGLSLTDCVSFEVMHRNGSDRAFAFDPHFEEQGFTTAVETIRFTTTPAE